MRRHNADTLTSSEGRNDEDQSPPLLSSSAGVLPRPSSLPITSMRCGSSRSGSSRSFASNARLSHCHTELSSAIHVHDATRRCVCNYSRAARFCASAMMAPGTSASCAPTTWLTPHFTQRYRMRYLGVDPSTPIGSIMPPQPAALSPGLRSTCMLHRHRGQWSVYPSPLTSKPQWPQAKSSIRLWNFLFLCII